MEGRWSFSIPYCVWRVPKNVCDHEELGLWARLVPKQYYLQVCQYLKQSRKLVKLFLGTKELIQVFCNFIVHSDQCFTFSSPKSSTVRSARWKHHTPSEHRYLHQSKMRNFPRLEFPFCVLKTSNHSSERLMFRPNVWLFPILAIMVNSRRTQPKTYSRTHMVQQLPTEGNITDNSGLSNTSTCATKLLKRCHKCNYVHIYQLDE